MQRVLSGIQPTGELHIGNYLGAIKNWVSLIDKYECFFCIVDYHAITIKYDVSLMQKYIHNAAVEYIASGLDPNKCTIFVQSHVPEHTELMWILNTVTPIGELERMTQYKDKAKQHSQNVNAGLLIYPVLQTADIIIYKANLVPVGEDQVQHIELAREIVRDFNNRYGEIFPEPKELLSNAPRVMGLDGVKKMSKSVGNHIALVDNEEVLKKKILPAPTDPSRVRRSDPGNPDICNIYSYHKFFSDSETLELVNNECRKAGIGCVDCKNKLIKFVVQELTPIQERIKELEKKPDYIKDVLNNGAKKCRSIAQETMTEVKKAMGLL